MRKLKTKAKIALSIIGAAAAAAIGIGIDRAVMKDALEKEAETLQIRVEYGEDVSDPDDLFSDVKDLVSVSGSVDPMKVGSYPLQVTLQRTSHFCFPVQVVRQVVVRVEDAEFPVIELDQTEALLLPDEDSTSLAKHVVSVTDPVDGTLEQSDSDILKRGTWVLDTKSDPSRGMVQAMDRNGNVSTAFFPVKRIEIPAVEHPYAIRINRAANTVTVYVMDADGAYSLPVKAMVCSTGKATPTGSYAITEKYRWRSLFGGVYGQYACRIVGNILFHSVPYFSVDPGNLEFEEYNKLGTNASMGCIRLCVEDEKWIYDHCPLGTPVELYDDEDYPGPLGKPVPLVIDVNDERRGWDPTDPDENNPWHLD